MEEQSRKRSCRRSARLGGGGGGGKGVGLHEACVTAACLWQGRREKDGQGVGAPSPKLINGRGNQDFGRPTPHAPRAHDQASCRNHHCRTRVAARRTRRRLRRSCTGAWPPPRGASTYTERPQAHDVNQIKVLRDSVGFPIHQATKHTMQRGRGDAKKNPPVGPPSTKLNRYLT